MTDEHDEPAIRAVLERQRPGRLPEGLAQRVDRVPDDVARLRPMWLRLSLGLAPWGGLALIAVVLASGSWRFTPLASGRGTPNDIAWSPAEPGGGFAEIGLFGLPWVPALAFIAALGAIEAVTRIRSGRPLVSMPSLRRRKSERPKPTTGEWIRSLVPTGVVYAVWLALAVVLPQDPILYGSTNDPGQGAADVRPGGTWADEQTDHPTTFSSVDRYVYEVEPGEAFAYVMSIKNDWPFPITILGLPGPEPDLGTDPRAHAFGFGWNGLGLLRDPAVISTDPADVVPFRPTPLAPGQEVVIVVAEEAWVCADPAGDFPVDPPDMQSSGPWIELVFDVFGWRQIGSTAPPFHVTVPVRPECLPRPF